MFAAVYRDGATTTRSFVVNRFARLYPLHLLTLVLVALLQVMAVQRFGAPLLYENNDAKHFALQLFFASAWRHWDQSFNGPIWSVSIEVLVYTLFWLLHRRLFVRGSLLPLALSMLFGLARWVGVGHLFFFCGQLFFLGCAIFMIHDAMTRPKVHVAFALTLLAAGAMLWWSDLLPLIVGMPLAFAGLVLLLSALDASALPRPERLLTMAGDNTYGMYLWHVPVQIAVILLAPSAARISEWAQSPWWLVAYLLLIVGVARLSFLLIEKPARERLRLWGKPRQRDAPIAAP